MDTIILKGEIYSRLSYLLKQYRVLLNQEFPTKGSRSLAKLLVKIIETIQFRYSKYKPRQLKQIGSLISDLETCCGYLHDSQISNVPWSMIPAIEKLFGKIKGNFEFAICPIWESNYQILNRNILEYYKNEVVSVPGLLFDSEDAEKFNKEVSDFVTGFPDGVYFIFFPRLERRSSLHFALLGHEIGHNYATKWLQEEFTNYTKRQKLEESFRAVATDEFTKFNQATGLELFVEPFAAEQNLKYISVTKKIISELISDIFGVCIFGESAFVASYIFSIKTAMDDTQSWEGGYTSWRYRLHFIHKALKYIHEKYSKNMFLETSSWKDAVDACVSTPFKDGVSAPNAYLAKILEAIDAEKELIWDFVIKNAAQQLFTNHLNNEEIRVAKQRLSNKITPNAILNETLVEKPIELRNILYATWLELGVCATDDYQEYQFISNAINLLSIKGIELSIEQESFNDFNKERDQEKAKPSSVGP